MEVAICVLKLIRTDSSFGPPRHGLAASSSSSIAGISSDTILARGNGASGNSISTCRAAQSLLANVVGLYREGPASISETWH